MIRVGADTSARIRAAAVELGYKPNSVAQSLVTGRTGVLGLIFPYSSAFIGGDPFCAQIMAGVIEEVVQEKCNIMLHTATGDDWNAAEDNALIDARVDGLLLTLPVPDSRVVEQCRRERFPYVALVYEPHLPDIYAVNADEEAGGRLATQHLIALGHRRIAHLIGDKRVATSAPRQRGYEAALRDVGIAVTEEYLVAAGFSAEGGHSGMNRLLQLPRERQPTAVFAANDLCAEGAIRAAKEQGRRIPEDIAFVGYDDTWFASMTQPTLTSVRMPIADIGRQATKMLIAQIEGREITERQPFLPVSLTVRESSGATKPALITSED